MGKGMNSTIDQFDEIVRSVNSDRDSAGMDLQVQFSILVTSLLKVRQWTQRDLAEKTGIRESQISDILHADANCTLRTIGRVLKAFGERGRIDLFMAQPIAAKEIDHGSKTFRFISSQADATIGEWAFFTSATKPRRPKFLSAPMGRQHDRQLSPRRTSSYLDLRNKLPRAGRKY